MRPLSVIVGLTLGCFAVAQSAPAKKPYGTLSFRTNVGSFKFLGSGSEPVEGTLTFSFEGTVLITDLKGDLKIEGAVRKEHEEKRYGKVAYFGRGKMTLTGSWRSCQFFGRKVNGAFKGWGIVRLYGEFDSNLSTGVFRRAEDRSDMPWGTGGTTVAIPTPNTAPVNVTPKVKRVGG